MNECGASQNLFRAVAMHYFHLISGMTKFLAYVLGNHDRAVLSAGTAEGDRQIALTFVNIVRQQEEQVGNSTRDELPRLRKRADVPGHAGIAPGQRPELWNEMRVGQEAHVENVI